MNTQEANPGGVLAPDQVIGRDALVVRLWRILEKRSVYITAERRMGKTSVIRDKMKQEVPAGARLIYMDVSKAGMPLEFVEKLLNESTFTLAFGEKAKLAFAGFASKYLPGVEFKAGVSVKLPASLGGDWKGTLENLLQTLSEHSERIIFAFDELPLMLLAIKRNAESGRGESVVMELLDTLRAARQTYPNLRMIYTGSLGLHHVLTGLREQGYQNDPTNDMALIEVEPLAPEDAVELGRRLLAGEGISAQDLEDSARHLATVTDGMPYYIHHLIEEISVKDLTGEPAVIDSLLDERLSDMRDPWHLRYYDERIDTHYAETDRHLSRLLLDQLAAADAPRSLDDLADGLDPERVNRDPEKVRAALRLLGMDHYISSDKKGGYGFRYPFLRRVWQAIRR